jgi:hypothetical protein
VAQSRNSIPQPCEAPPVAEPATPHDLRFRTLLGRTAWASLPAAVQQRFGKRPAGGAAVTYVGEITECRMSRAGFLLARLCLAIGGPLPLHRDVGVPAVVAVTEDPSTGGQFWTRIYGRKDGFPRVILSRKRFSGPTGLEEYLGYGIGIALKLSADSTALHFHSDHYFLSVGPLRVRLPGFLAPGALTISHVAYQDEWFAFVLDLRHRRLGELIHQTCVFREYGVRGMA